jgi:hypothetical protein
VFFRFPLRAVHLALYVGAVAAGPVESLGPPSGHFFRLDFPPEYAGGRDRRLIRGWPRGWAGRSTSSHYGRKVHAPAFAGLEQARRLLLLLLLLAVLGHQRQQDVLVLAAAAAVESEIGVASGYVE